MNLQISGKNMDLTPAIKEYAEEKLGAIVRFNDTIIETRVTIERGHEHHDNVYTVTAHTHIPHDELHCHVTHADVNAAIDLAKDELERQLRDIKEKYASKNRKAQDTQREMKSIFKAEELEEQDQD